MCHSIDARWALLDVASVRHGDTHLVANTIVYCPTDSLFVQSTRMMTSSVARFFTHLPLFIPYFESTLSLLDLKMDVDNLRQLLEQREYGKALEVVVQAPDEDRAGLTSYIRQLEFSQADPSAYTPAQLRSQLADIVDDAWVVEACAAVLEGDVDCVRASVEIGLERSKAVGPWLEERLGTTLNDDRDVWERIQQVLEGNEDRRRLVMARAVLLDRRRRLQTYTQLFATHAEPVTADDDSIEIDDPWADADSNASEKMDVDSTPSRTESKVPLSTFLSAPMVQVAVSLAASGDIASLVQFYGQYRVELFPYRYSIIDTVPSYAAPQDLEGLLPRITREGEESGPTASDTDVDTCLAQHAQASTAPTNPPLSAHEASQWYQERIHRVESDLLVDLALEWCQTAISHGAVGLEDTARDLSFLVKLVYDAATEQTYSLDTWRTMSDDERVQAYLSSSTVASLAADIRRLVFPYLESLSDSAQVKRKALQRFTLEAPLEKSLAIFEASKATLPLRERIIDNDVDVARLALARLYGDDSVDRWDIKSSIFECLPVWDVAGDELDEDTSREVTATTLESLAAFMQPSTTAPVPGPTDLLLFFEPLPFVALSRALDILDVHLESGEILAKWNVPAPLRTFLQTAFDREEQRRWAVRTARQAGNAGFEEEDEWISLMDDMIKLSGGGDGLLKGAFGLLGKEEVLKIFFGGVLSSGRE